MVALGFEPRLSETKVWHLITKPCNLPLEIDLEINMGEESIQMEGTIFQRYNDIFSLGGEARGLTKGEVQKWEHGLRISLQH